MTETLDSSRQASPEQAALPSRLHHTAYVTKDQEATRAFYEEVIGLPLTATWKESDELFGAVRTYCHTFYGLGDGGALAFFQFVDPADQEQFGPEMPHSPFQHIALKVSEETQDAIAARLKAADWKPEQTYVLEHGYCRSLYTEDPNGLLLEFTLDAPGVEDSAEARRASARAELKSWIEGDHHSNNNWR
ncbi:VOC family protein [Streptacidiphilus sp. N1-10]|uniref:VOC family protein n=1 Tax=Streptacidiphilus jeojiensis TaxID=3229225 RepID=A0ABV6XPH7_9ACTN